MYENENEMRSHNQYNIFIITLTLILSCQYLTGKVGVGIESLGKKTEIPSFSTSMSTSDVNQPELDSVLWSALPFYASKSKLKP